MSTVDKTANISKLRAWQVKRLAEHGEAPAFHKAGPTNVTVLCYFYRPAEQVNEHFPYTICALYETWRHCGMMKTTLVVNKISKPIEAFRRLHANWVTVQEEPALTPGNVDVMSVDCNTKLYSRFTTPYVLIVQDDGFPLRPGLERFVGKADYLGSPFRRRNLIGRLASLLLRDCPGNGGFSLRSEKICRLASEYWHRHYANKPFGPEQVEDIFYSQTLPRRFLSYRFTVHIAGPRQASDFSYDGCVPGNLIPAPFGFHSARAFETLYQHGYIR